MNSPLQMNPYLNFKGQCEEAFQFYAKHLGATIGDLFRYAGSPMAEQAPAGWENKIMHGSITVGSQVLMAADVAPDRFEELKGFSLSLNIKDTTEADRMFRELAAGGRIVVPIAKTFWADRFGMLVDRFGVPWMINCEGSAKPQG